MFEHKVSLEVAQAEVTGWLDYLKITPGLRKSNADSIDTLVEAVSLGLVEVVEDAEKGTHLKQNLQFPVGETAQLTYKSRLNDFMLAPYLKGVKASDGDARILAYKAALTGQLSPTIQKLDSSDQRIVNAIVVFFIG